MLSIYTDSHFWLKPVGLYQRQVLDPTYFRAVHFFGARWMSNIHFK